MATTIYCYTIYHSSNAYLGTWLLRRGLEKLPDVRLVRRPIFVPRERGVLVAEMLGGKENAHAGSYHREDCLRWADRYCIPLVYPEPHLFGERRKRWAQSPFHREELPARAYYATEPAARDRLDAALFEAAWVAGFDVNEPEAIRWAANRAGLDGGRLLAACEGEQAMREAMQAVAEFDRAACPGVPTMVVNGERFFGKDRVDWVIERCREACRARN